MTATSIPTAASERTIRWGILGAGRIAHRFAASLAQEPHSQLVAVSCRSAEKAHAFADTWGVDAAGALSDEALGGVAGAAHEALIERDDIDALYIALPHALHHAWVVRALEAGRAVLCEKPATISAPEMEDIARVARERGVLFMEAMKTRFTPLYEHIAQLVRTGAIGDVRRVEASLGGDMRARLTRPGDYLSNAVGGGVLLDCGIYAVNWIEDFLPEPCALTCADARFLGDVESFVDATFSAGSATGRVCVAGDDASVSRQARIEGTEGTIVIENMHRPAHAHLIRRDAEPLDIDLPYVVDDFFGEISHMAALLLSGQSESPIMPLDASINCARIIDDVRAAITHA